MPVAAARRFMKWNGNEGKYLKHDSDVAFNDQYFVLEPRWRRRRLSQVRGEGRSRQSATLGPIFPKDEAPQRASLADTRPERVADWQVL